MIIKGVYTTDGCNDTDQEILMVVNDDMSCADIMKLAEAYRFDMPYGRLKKVEILKQYDHTDDKKETIQNQDEMIRDLINAQETLQEEIEKLKKGHILYYDEE